MCENTKFLSCGDCKSVLIRLPGDFPGAPEGLKALEAGVTDAAKEKHIPVAKVLLNHLQESEHYIIYFQLF